MGIMENFEKILELLQKQTLTEEEKLSLEQFANSDEEIKSFINVYKDHKFISFCIRVIFTLIYYLLSFYLKREMNLNLKID